MKDQTLPWDIRPKKNGSQFLRLTLNILDFQQLGMMKIIRIVEALFWFLASKVVKFCFEPEKMWQKSMKLSRIYGFARVFFVNLGWFLYSQEKISKHYRPKSKRAWTILIISIIPNCWESKTFKISLQKVWSSISIFVLSQFYQERPMSTLVPWIKVQQTLLKSKKIPTCMPLFQPALLLNLRFLSKNHNS